ncbi:MAG: SDR family oxidoreductase [Verrucomicrobia bacterium]|nr:SDR family oxidoreductase [Verrucomicrobiota bacterium]
MHKTVLITGVSRGLGLACARRLLEGGWRVCGVSRSESAEWSALARAHAGMTEWRSWDLERTERIEAGVQEFLPLTRPVHALVNNAAVAYDDLATNVSLARLEAMLAVNVVAPMMITRAVIRNMLCHEVRGSIIHISSVSVRSGARGLAMYAASKGAMEAFSRGIAQEWGPRGIRSNCVVPGYMETEMTAGLTADQRTRIRRQAALRRETDVESVAATVGFLLGDESSAITGQEIVVDAGLS